MKKLVLITFILLIIMSLGTHEVYSKSKDSIKITKKIKFIGKPENLGRNINTKYDELLPIISPDGKTLFFARMDSPENIGGIKGQNVDIWISELDSTNNWNLAYNIGKPLNDIDPNFVCSITPDGNTLLLANTYGHGKGCSISHKTTRGWTFPKKINIKNFYTNSKYVSYYLANDNKTLLMAVERNDGFGNLDIFVSFILNDSTWSEPINLGNVINTKENEVSPFLASDGKTLFFASKGFNGFGGFDIYVSKRLDDSWQNWTEPENLGPQVNTKYYDLYFTIPASGDYAYFSSYNNSIGKSDIFRIKIDTINIGNVLVQGKVFNKKTGNPITGKSIIIKYERLSDGKEMGTARTNPNTGEYKVTLPNCEFYACRADADGYWGISQNVDLSNDCLSGYKDSTVNLYLSPFDTLKVNVFFGLDSIKLRPESYPDLQRVVKLLNENTNWEIKVTGHTCNRGSAYHNLILSRNRAKAVKDYLKKEGIVKERIKIKGYGESKPIYPNDTESNREKNRRVEIIIKKK